MEPEEVGLVAPGGRGPAPAVGVGVAGEVAVEGGGLGGRPDRAVGIVAVLQTDRLGPDAAREGGQAGPAAEDLGEVVEPADLPAQPEVGVAGGRVLGAGQGAGSGHHPPGPIRAAEFTADDRVEDGAVPTREDLPGDPPADANRGRRAQGWQPTRWGPPGQTGPTALGPAQGSTARLGVTAPQPDRRVVAEGVDRGPGQGADRWPDLRRIPAEQRQVLPDQEPGPVGLAVEGLGGDVGRHPEQVEPGSDHGPDVMAEAFLGNIVEEAGRGPVGDALGEDALTVDPQMKSSTSMVRRPVRHSRRSLTSPSAVRTATATS